MAIQHTHTHAWFTENRISHQGHTHMVYGELNLASGTILIKNKA